MKQTKNNTLQNHVSILNHVCEEFGITNDEIFAKTRKRKFLYPRQLFQMLCKKHTTYSLATIGFIGKAHTGVVQDHATVINSIASIESVLSQDLPLRKAANRIELNICNKFKIKLDISIVKEEVKNSIDKSKDMESLIKLLQFQSIKLQENESKS
jgi:hypothetical protein